MTVLSRQESTKTFPESVKVIKSDFSPSSIESAFKGQDAVISLVGHAGFEGQKVVVDAAAKAGVKRFIPSEFGSDTANARVCELVPIFNRKRAIIDYTKSKEAEGLSWTGVITGPFLDWGLRTGFLGVNLSSHSAKIWDGGSVPFTATNLDTIGKALVAVLSTPELVEQSKNTYIYVASLTATQNDILAILEKLTGKSWTTEAVSSKQVSKDGLEKFGMGDFSVVGGLIQSAIFGDEKLGDLSRMLWNEKLGLLKEDLETVIKNVLDEKTP